MADQTTAEALAAPTLGEAAGRVVHEEERGA